MDMFLNSRVFPNYEKLIRQSFNPYFKWIGFLINNPIAHCDTIEMF